MKILILIILASSLIGAEVKLLTIVEEDDRHELTDNECITAFMKLVTTKLPYKDPGLPPIGGGDTKIVNGKRVLCEVNIGLEYFSVGGRKFSIPKETLPIIKLAIEGPEKSWSMGKMEGADGKWVERRIETRDIAIQKKLSSALLKYFGEKDKGKDSDPMMSGPRYIFNNYPGEERLEYDIDGHFIYNRKSVIKLTDAENESLLAILQSVDKGGLVKKAK